MSTVAPPVLDPQLKPKPGDEMIREANRQGPDLPERSQPDAVETERDPQFARNGE